jgi:hypothetical protein
LAASTALAPLPPVALARALCAGGVEGAVLGIDGARVLTLRALEPAAGRVDEAGRDRRGG